jgi:hypothetical protein
LFPPFRIRANRPSQVLRHRLPVHDRESIAAGPSSEFTSGRSSKTP